jgi:hypothetical protein
MQIDEAKVCRVIALIANALDAHEEECAKVISEKARCDFQTSRAFVVEVAKNARAVIAQKGER